jgi:hypothetical protein
MSYIDGNYANAFLTRVDLSFPLATPNNGGTSQVDAVWVQNAANYSSKAVGATNPAFSGYYLSANGPLRYIGAGLVEYSETYNGLPSSWGEVEQVVFTFPGRSGIGADNVWSPYLLAKPITIPRIATITHTYSLTQPTPDTITVITDDGLPVDYIGQQNPENGVGLTVPSTPPSTYTISSDVRLWKGSIWEKITKTVTPP